MSISFPWPPSELSPNSRVHWSRRARFAKGYKKTCWALTIKEGLAVTWDGPVHLWLTFFPPDRRARDDDNMIGAFKYGRDGLALGLGIDDKRFVLHPVVSDQTGGRVVAKITRGPE